ncbi:MAG: sulfurtransferase complex subunit TusC [Parahaliea sp.]
MNNIEKPLKRILLISRQPPYAGNLARAALDTTLAAAAFDQAPSLLFIGDGVLQLLAQQDSSGIGSRNHAKVLASLPLYDIEHYYVEAKALVDYHIRADQLPPQAQILTREEIHQLFDEHDHVLSF